MKLACVIVLYVFMFSSYGKQEQMVTEVIRPIAWVEVGGFTLA